jgi:hypothetical protein
LFKSSSEKTTHAAVQQKALATSFFRKAGEESFFGEKARPFFFSGPIQTKLSVSSPDDPQEKEADAVADRVMRMADPAPVAASEKKEELQRSQDQNNSHESTPQTIQCREENEEEIHRKEKEEEKLQAKQFVTVQAKESSAEENIHPKLFRKIHRSAEEHEVSTESSADSADGYNINRKEISIHHSDVIQRSGRGPPQSSMQFEQSLSSSKGAGSALPSDTRQFMESRFGADFSGVKIHTGIAAENLSTTIQAQAFTHGNDIYFNSGKYSPHTADGSSLLAHELTHTIQQGASKTTSSFVNNNSVAAKKIQRRNTSRLNDHSQKIIPPLERPRSLKDLRKEAFNIDRKEENVTDDSPSSQHEETVQTKTEFSNRNVDAGGSLQTASKLVTANPPITIQSKDDTDNRKEEEKLQSSSTAIMQRKALTGLQRKNQNETVTSISRQNQSSVQLQAEFNNSSLNHKTDASSSMQSDEKDRGPPSVQLKSNTGILIQRSWLGNAWNAVSGFVSEAADVIARGLDAAKEWILRRIKTFVQNIPGYNILALILQHDPITHEPVERSGRNILLAGLQLIPGGDFFRLVLERLNALNDAAAWIDGRMSDLMSMVSSIGNRFTQFMDSLSLDDIGNPEAVLNRVADLFRGVFNDVTGFMTRAAVDFLGMIKRIMLRLIVDFVRERVPRLYPLLRVALGHDPVTGEDVPRNGHNILYAALDATDEGREQRRQMEETGTFDRVAAWIDRAIAVFTTAYQLLRQAFTNLWSAVTIESLFSPIETFNRIYNDFAAPITLVGNFLRDLAIEILRLIKNALLRRLRDYAKTVRGYSLVTVILGFDPFTHENVPRTIPNIIRGFMSLMEGGEDQYRQMEESGAIARTTQQIEAAVARLNMTPAYIIQLFIDLWNSFSLHDLAHPIDAFMRIVRRFGEPIGRLIAFVIEIVKIVIHVILEIMNFPFDLINNIITRAMAAFERIKQDPIGFLKNLLRAIKQGFIQFFNNILRHLLNGLTGWLMSELRDANVPAPTDFTLRGIIGWVLQVLGISMEAIWTKLAAHPRIGPQRVARIRSMIDRLEGIWTFIKDVQERGMAAIWDKIQEQLSNLWNTVLDAVKNWVMERIVNQMVTRLLSMLDPTGIMAVINSAIAIYRAVQSFIRYLRQMLEVINSFVNGVADIAEGNVTTAANYLENTMDRAMPIVIGFLANQVGLSGIGRRIGEMVVRVREMVDRALTWLVNRAVDAGFALFDRLMAMGRSAVSAITDRFRNLLGLTQQFSTRDGRNHNIHFEPSGQTVRLIVASTPKPLETLVTDRRAQITQENTATPAKVTENQSKLNALDRITVLKSEVDALRAQYAEAVDNPSARQPTLLQSQINQKMNSVVEQLIIAGIDVEGANNIETHVENQSAGDGRPGRVIAQPLTRIPGNTAGSTPQVDPLGKSVVTPSVWTSNWVAAHLLNHNLHGPGLGWNLVSGTKETNNNMKTEIENVAKTEVDANPNKQYYYEVNVSYYSPQTGREFMKFFPFQINVQFGELMGQPGSFTRGPARGRAFTQDSPDLTNTVMPAFNESSASRLWEASRNAGKSIPRTVFAEIVEARRSIASQSFGNSVSDMISFMDNYYFTHGLGTIGSFTSRYGADLQALAATHIFMHY